MDLNERRGRRRGLRDLVYLSAGICLVGVTIFGIVAAGALIAGSPLGSARGATNGDPSSAAEATATAIVRQSLTHAHASEAAIVRQARRQARKILREARNASHSHSHPHPRATATPVPRPTIRPAPQSTPTIVGAPDVTGLPASWEVIVFGLDPTGGTVKILNRASAPRNGTIYVTYLRANGRVAAMRGARFSNAAPRSVTIVHISPAPLHWATYKLSVTRIT